MKVRVAYTVDANDRYRLSINLYYGRPGLATREQVAEFCMTYGDSMDADLDSIFENHVAEMIERMGLTDV